MILTRKLKKWVSMLTLGSLLLGVAVPAASAAGEGEAGAAGIATEAAVREPAQAAGAAAEEGAAGVATEAAVSDPVQTAAEAGPTGPALLITEMVPDTNNVNGADAYEFVEVYNNTDQPVNFAENYYFFYNNVDPWSMTNKEAPVVIPAQKAVVFWIMNGKNAAETVDGFVANFATDVALQEGVNLFRIEGGGGMANTAARNLQIRERGSDAVVVSASYEASHVKLNKGIFFSHPEGASKNMNVMMPDSGTLAATPGTVTTQQITPPATTEVEPVIVHTPASSIEAADYVVAASVQNFSDFEEGKLPAMELLYKTPSQARYTVVSMMDKGAGQFSAMIPAAALVEPVLEYKLRVKDTSVSYSVQVNMPEFDSEKAPDLLVTELLPNSTNVSGTSSDAYEFIEIYNNTDQPLNFNDYKIYYRYPDKGPSADVKWASTKEDFIIPAGQSVVFWIMNSANSDYTVQDFNSFFNTALVENQELFIIKSDGMANSGRRAVVIKTNTGTEISAAYYDADQMYDGGVKSDETKEDRGIQYKYPVNGSSTMIKASSGMAKASPGKVDPSQVPAEPKHVIPDTAPPVVTEFTNVTQIDQSKTLDLKVRAEDDKQITSVEAFVRSDKQPVFVSQHLTEDYNDKLYHYKLPSADLIGRAYVEYYFRVSDGTNIVETNIKKVEIVGGPDQSPLRLNVKDGDIISGTAIIKGTAQNAGQEQLTLFIDGKEIAASSTTQALENDAYFVFEAKNVDYYFKNGITMGPPELGDETILYTFMDPIPNYTTLSFPIPAERLQLGSDNVIYIRAGSKSSPFDPRPEENKDDFEIKNIRLLLADGTEIRDPLYAERDKEIKMGDSAGKHEWLGFQFTLTPDMLKSKSYAWNTAELADGSHEIKVKHGAGEVTAKVMVDNTAPSIKTSVEEGKQYRGNFEINADISDALSGVEQVEVKLDGQLIALPYATSSGKLDGGSHTLFIKAIDKAGNAAEKTVHFEVPDENPNAPLLVGPKDGQSDVGSNPSLIVKVEDPEGDALNVSFYKGYKYDGQHKTGFKGFQHASDTEPPKVMIPGGEQALTEDDYVKIGAADGQYLVNDSVEQFPYQRYEIKLDPTVKATDQAVIEWKGNSLEGRKVSLYAWSYSSGKWELLNSQIAGTEDFELKAAVKAGDYAKDHTIQILVQDEIAAYSSPSPVTEDRYDFTIGWMSDTQYYSQSYPYIYQSIVQWFADNKDRINLKYIVHTGDIVDKEYQEYEWIEADKDMKVLEAANIPYGVLAGNHDVGHQNNDYTKYYEYFGDWRFKDMPTFGGSYKNNRGHYDLVSAGGNDFIIVYMGWGLADEEIEWMNEVVSRYPERKAILALHEYLLVSNNRAPIADKIYEKVVMPNKNVFATLSGHYHDSQLKVDELDDDGDGIADRKVYQILADYQGAAEGGLGYIRLLQFDIENNKLHVKTYSPYLNQYNYYDPAEFPGKDEFSLDLDLQPKTKRVATDYIGVKIYTDQLIGSIKDVPSGTEASLKWEKLSPQTNYQWYVKAEDANSGMVLSDIWSFQTGEADAPGGGDGGSGGSDGGSGGSGGSSTGPVDPKPVTQPTVENGIIKFAPGTADGKYIADRAAMEKAMQQANSGKIGVRIDDQVPSGSKQRVELDAAAWQEAVKRKLLLEIVTPSVTVKVPASSLPDQAADAETVVLELEALNQDSEPLHNPWVKAKDKLRPTGVAYGLTLRMIKDGKETLLQQLKEPVTIVITLTADQLRQINIDYAGVYSLAKGETNYVGGKFEGSRVTFTADQLSQYAILEFYKAFEDVTGGWAEPYIKKLAAKHIIRGIDDYRFGPAQNVSRADFATLVIRALGMPETDHQSRPAFGDVPESAYYAEYVAKAAALGIVQGSGGKFRPLVTVTREEAAVMMARMAAYMGKTKKNEVSSASFADIGLTSSWAVDAVNEVKTLGIMNGKGGNRFDPKGHVTRAELAKMLYQLLNS
ncbi:S-layer homology domain-containing protein [Paenibacillus sp. GCM10027626]|uniref:S-layer homology domain-containing protein n=1 Tax=Paenibacillus sp. GCM10027626 TaxID=3273411 RepID=UPI003635CCB1